jgi:hypothetical protein
MNRAAMTALTRKIRAYFAPSTQAFDPGAATVMPPSGWTDLGWIENLKRTPGTRIEAVRAGEKGAAAVQFRSGLDACVEFDFVEWGKLQMALSVGGQHMNVLAATPAVPVLTSGPTQLVLATGGAFSAGDLIAVDVDYTGQTGAVGSGMAGAWVKSAADVHDDPDYVRRVTFNVARVSGVNGASLILQQPLLCPVPAEAKAQRVLAFTDREGGSFFQEWSALLSIEDETGGSIWFYYPRVQAAAPAAESSFEIANPLRGLTLHASLRALPTRDAHDNEQVLCYRMYFPAASAAVY